MQSNKPSFPYFNIDTNMELMNQFPELNPIAVENSNLNFQSFMGFSNENFPIKQAPEFPENLPAGILYPHDKNVMAVLEPIVSAGMDFHESKQIKSVDASESSTSGISTPAVSEDGTKRKNSSGRGKRVKSDEKEEEKQKEVVHVRSKRGQSTNSHSVAERIRRGKINEKLRCLQDIVPGCYKTMGMAGTLDEIINYVQSLKNQVEFLSMKLTVASSFYDFNSDTATMERIQRTKAHEAQNVERLMRGHEAIACTQLGSFDLTFGCSTSLPYNA